MTPRKFQAAGNRPVEIGTGATFAPGEPAPGVDPSDPHDAVQIDEGRLVDVTPERTSKAKTSHTKEASK